MEELVLGARQLLYQLSAVIVRKIARKKMSFI